MAGAPIGNTNAASSKKWQAAIERAIASYPDRPNDDGCSDLIKGLNAAAYEFVCGVMVDKSIAFFREFGDRLEGKPNQAIDLGSDPERPMIQKLIREIVKPNDQDR